MSKKYLNQGLSVLCIGTKKINIITFFKYYLCKIYPT